MQVYKGLSASPGLVMGPIYQVEHGGNRLGRVVDLPAREKTLFEAAVILAKEELRQLEEAAEGDEKDILMFQRVMLDDSGLNQEIQRRIEAGEGSAAAVERTADIFARRMSEIPDEYISQRGTDILDACRRVVDILDGKERTPAELKIPSILAGECIYPSDIIAAGKGMVLGLASAAGSIQSHAAIIARTMGIPTVVHLGDQFLREGVLKHVILDADNGRLVVDPGKVQIQAAQRRIVSAAMLKKRLAVLSDKPCVTVDGTHIGLWANCSTAEDIALAIKNGAEGVGLLRSEFMITNNRIPGEEQQYYFYVSCLQAAKGRRVTVRTFDIGADKSIPGLSEDSPNPALGIRGIRQCLILPNLLIEQLCALFRASTKGNLRIMFPMIAGPRDWDRAMELVEKAKEILRSREVPFKEDVPIGSMVEIPSAALMANELLDHGCEFFSIGTNDLTQYTYAADRLDGRFSECFNGPSDAVHKLIDLTVEAAQRHGTEVCLCGLSAEDPKRAVRYAKQGVYDLSVTPSAILQVKASLLETDLREEAAGSKECSAASYD